jgi:hypothetical protein
MLVQLHSNGKGIVSPNLGNALSTLRWKTSQFGAAFIGVRPSGIGYCDSIAIGSQFIDQLYSIHKYDLTVVAQVT